MGIEAIEVFPVDNLQVGSVKVWRRSSVGPVEYFRGPATTKVATQVRMARQSFLSWPRVAEVSGIGYCFAGDQDAVDTEQCQEENRMNPTELTGSSSRGKVSSSCKHLY